MERAIEGFEHDRQGDWVARLNCGHVQQPRHNPPFNDRPWTETVDGRASQIGRVLNCVLCDRLELPPHFVAYSHTPAFSARAVPSGLRKDHATKAGVWAKIVVLEGELRYRVPAMETDVVLSNRQPGVVAPEVNHHVEPIGAVQFFVEFYRRPDEDG